jgi:hypothetical protein
MVMVVVVVMVMVMMMVVVVVAGMALSTPLIDNQTQCLAPDHPSPSRFISMPPVFISACLLALTIIIIIIIIIINRLRRGTAAAHVCTVNTLNHVPAHARRSAHLDSRLSQSFNGRIIRFSLPE